MLQAVLDTNIWLATHVVAITTGYSAMFTSKNVAFGSSNLAAVVV
jgi:hypothetical protein